MRASIEARRLDVELPEALAHQIHERLDDMSGRFPFCESVHVVVSKQRGFYACEVTLQAKHQTLRSEERSNDLGNAVDSSLDKLERQLHRHKGRLLSRSRAGDREIPPPLVDFQPDEPEEEFETPRVVRVKRIALKPMSPEEAALQMELLGHDFFVFRNDETDDLNVVYRRLNGDFGLILPE